MKTEILKEQYQALVLETLRKHSCIPNIDDEAEQLTSKLIALHPPTKKRQKSNDKSPFLIMRDALIGKFGADKAESFFLSLADNEQLKKRSIHIPTTKRIKQIFSQ